MSMCVHIHMLTYTGRNGGRERESKNLLPSEKKMNLLRKKLDRYILEIFSR